MKPNAFHLALILRHQSRDGVVRKLREQNFDRPQVTQILRTLSSAEQQMAQALDIAIRARLEVKRDPRYEVSYLGADFPSLASGFNEVSYKFSELHLDNIGLEFLRNIRDTLVDPAAYRLRKDVENKTEIQRQQNLQEQSEYTEALNLAKDTPEETNLPKLDVMLRDIRLLLEQATAHASLAMDAKVHLASLCDSYFDEWELARELYEQALGEKFSHHYIRVAILLADLERRHNMFESAITRLKPLIDRFLQLDQLTTDLQELRTSGWPTKERNLCKFLSHSAQSSLQSADAQDILDIISSKHKYSAIRKLEQYGDGLMHELKAARPELDIFFHVARITAALGDKDLANELVMFACDRLPSRESKNILLCEVEGNRVLLA
jgi:hypothetical protein